MESENVTAIEENWRSNMPVKSSLSENYPIDCMIALQFRFFYFIIMPAFNAPINVLIVLIGG